MEAPERWGRYVLLRPLGAGGMAQVFLARQDGPAGFERFLVVKRILPGKLDDPVAVRSFLDEARLVARLSHPHIAQVHDFGEVAGSFFLAMELVRGPDLRKILGTVAARGEHMAPEVCALIAHQTAGALDYAHSLLDPQSREPLRIVHRDISPDNLVVSTDGHVKIVDFGIAQAAATADGTRVEKLRGKVPYMSPEVLRGELADRGADLFALGLVLYEMAAGRRAIVGSRQQMLDAARARQFPPPETLHPGIPPAILAIIHRSVARDPKDRYRTARELQIDLDAILRATPCTNHDLARLVRRLYPDGADPLSTGPQPETPRFAAGEHTTQPQPDTLGITALPPSAPVRFRPWTLVAALAGAALVGSISIGYAVLKLRRGAEIAPAFPPGIEMPAASAPAPATAPETPAAHRSPPRPRPARAGHGVLIVEASPGGDVFVDRVRVGTAPLRKAVAAGTHEIAVRHLGAEKRATLPIAVDEERRVSFQFAMGELKVFAMPWALVAVDGREYGATPLEPIALPEGRHTVTLSSPELKRTVTRTVEVPARGSVDLRIDLRK